MIVAIHQPNFLPWLGYFHKMARADLFVFLDTAAFAKGSYTNRVQVKTARGPQWLTVPVQTSGRLGQPIRAVVCDARTDWRSRVVRTLETNYRGCPYYAPLGPWLARAIAEADDSLADLNMRLILEIARQLGIRTPTRRASALGAEGKATDLLVALCRELGADTYLSGSGGSKYQDEGAFREAGIRLVYNEFRHPVYPQAFGEFVPGLSIVDLLLNCGPDSGALLGISPS